MKKDNLGERMKRYEMVTRTKLLRRTPVIIRIDGKAFHTWTKNCEKPFDHKLHNLMVETTKFLCENIQNCVFGYTQSDEISLFLRDYDRIVTEQWFDGDVQKIDSISASLATGYFNKYSSEINNNLAFFDARCKNLPKDEVVNYFVWRQQDATRNSIQMLGRHYFSHKELHKKNTSQIQDMLFLNHNINWNNLETWKKRGTAVYKINGKFIIDEEMPILTQNRNYIEVEIENAH